MQIRTKSRVAITAILDVAVHGGDNPVSLASISERQRVSVSYLEQIFQKLRLQGFVTSYRGPGGGYRLSRNLAKISVADVINAVDCEASRDDLRAGQEESDCVADRLWYRVNDHLRDYLRAVSLHSVLTSVGTTGDLGETAVAAETSLPTGRLPSRHQPETVVAMA